MKDLNRSSELDKARSEYEIKKQQEYKLVGKIRKIKGLKLFEFNTDNMTLGEYRPHMIAELTEAGNVISRNNVEYNPEYLYIQALNYEAAMKKINKILERHMGVKEFFQTKYIKNLKK